MKYIFTFISLVGCLLLNGQGFEGTMKWKMTTEYSDPTMKAKAEEAAKKMNDPALKEQRAAQLKKQMEDPKMKALMEQNPTMKAQMEQMMAGSNSSGGSMTPTGVTVKMKNGNVLSKIEGGMMSNMEVLFLKDKGQSIRLDRSTKTYTTMPVAGASANKSNIKVTKTTDQKKVLDYNCTKYIVESMGNGKSMTQVYWATEEIKDWDMKSLAQQRVGNTAIFLEEVKGVPLQIEVVNPGVKMVMEVTEISKATLSDSEFSIPADYKERALPGSVK